MTILAFGDILIEATLKGDIFMKTKDLIICAVFAAVLCVFSVMTIPIGVIPISMGVFGVILTSCILGWKKGTISVIVYILLGAVGLPIFSGFKGGIAVLAGPTGGYIWSYTLMALFIGFFTAKLPRNKPLAVVKLSVISFIGVIICYLFGTLQFMLVAHKTFVQAVTVCVYPFIPFDIVKSVVGGGIAYAVRYALVKTKLLSV